MAVAGLSDFLKRVKGRNISIGGNRWIGKKTAEKAEKTTRLLIRKGYCIITGGAEGADHAVMRACLGCKIQEKRLRIFLPSTIERQYLRYRKLEGAGKARALLTTLLGIRRAYPRAITEGRRGGYRKAAESRNSLILKHSDGCILFEPSGSRGSADALRKIRARKMPFLIVR